MSKRKKSPVRWPETEARSYTLASLLLRAKVSHTVERQTPLHGSPRHVFRIGHDPRKPDVTVVLQGATYVVKYQNVTLVSVVRTNPEAVMKIIMAKYNREFNRRQDEKERSLKASDAPADVAGSAYRSQKAEGMAGGDKTGRPDNRRVDSP